ncbi:O-antigen/teichoic acid export membrane protein [Maribacter vaceletii]|uniref:O-antigen/teichoic acid export membrane protein n=1 Tax=Maribacter vaceletii TaxID=1206816 RepID=A0A495DSR6_9FLAO|nr:lipopolysaccharide biosynthesis protein [Maribacter vaceletii]RKR07185.1 O-antigen/teichoic acid export membrane protein [Maribacter vaceletii]
MTLKNKAIKGFSWTAFEGVFSQGFLFVIGILLARILEPEDIGLIGLITAVIAITNSIVEGGLGSALIRKVECNSKDYNTVFFTNLGIGILLYIILFNSSSELSIFFKAPLLSKILKYAGLLLIINACSIVQRTILTKKLDFKTQAIISIIASITSGVSAFIMAYLDYGIWSLVVLAILRPLINSILLWLKKIWRPRLEFSTKSFNELFNFGYKLLVANLINTVYRNFYYILIGKYFSTQSLGYYTRAEGFQSPFSSNISTAIRRISFPILSSLQNDPKPLKATFIKFLRFSLFLNFTIMLSISAMAKPIILLLIGEKWHTSIYYLQLLCIPGMLYPLQILHLNLLLIKGYSNLNLKLEIVKKIILLPLIFGSVLLGIEAMIYALIVFSFVEYFINSYYTKKIIKYTIIHQLKDILPFLTIAVLVFISMYCITLLNIHYIAMLVAQIIIGIATFLIVNEVLQLNEYIEVKKKAINLFLKSTKNIWKKK